MGDAGKNPARRLAGQASAAFAGGIFAEKNPQAGSLRFQIRLH